MEKTRILIVEDEPTIVRYLREDLESEGFEVIVAMNGNQGLETFKRESPDLVFLDIKMPGMDGFELCRRIKELSFTPVIMLTALHSEEDKVKAFDLGADDFVTKFYSRGELIARIKALLRRSMKSGNGSGRRF